MQFARVLVAGLRVWETTRTTVTQPGQEEDGGRGGEGGGEWRGQGAEDSGECGEGPEGLHHLGESPGCAGPPSPSRLSLRDFLVRVLSRLSPLGLLLCSCLLLIASFSKSHSGCLSQSLRG